MTVCVLRAFALALALAVPATAFAQQPSKSAPLVSELAKLLDEHKLDSFAARAADDYVAALYFPGTQLLVVSAKYPVPERMNQLISDKAYRDAYIDLSSATERTTRLFVSDLGVNGLRFKRENNEPFDTVDIGGTSVAFDGEWGRARMSEAEYTKSFQSTDERYSRMLEALIAAIKKPS